MTDPTYPRPYEYMTTTKAAQRLKVTRQHVSLLWRQGKLAGRKRGRDIEIDPESVEKYRTSQTS